MFFGESGGDSLVSSAPEGEHLILFFYELVSVKLLESSLLLRSSSSSLFSEILFSVPSSCKYADAKVIFEIFLLGLALQSLLGECDL